MSRKSLRIAGVEPNVRRSFRLAGLDPEPEPEPVPPKQCDYSIIEAAKNEARSEIKKRIDERFQR